MNRNFGNHLLQGPSVVYQRWPGRGALPRLWQQGALIRQQAARAYQGVCFTSGICDEGQDFMTIHI